MKNIDISEFTYTKEPLYDVNKELVWNVFCERNDKIYVENVFDHGCFARDLYNIKKKYKDNFDQFSSAVMTSLRYYFWSRSEHEIILTSWPPYIENEEIDRLVDERARRIKDYGKFYREDVRLNVAEKIDIYDQIKINWPQFISYLWNNLKLIKKVK